MNISKEFIPNQVIKSIAIFNKELIITSSLIKRVSYGTDIKDTEKIFNWTSIQLQKTLNHMTKSLKFFEI